MNQECNIASSLCPYCNKSSIGTRRCDEKCHDCTGVNLCYACLRTWHQCRYVKGSIICGIKPTEQGHYVCPNMPHYSYEPIFVYREALEKAEMLKEKLKPGDICSRCGSHSWVEVQGEVIDVRRCESCHLRWHVCSVIGHMCYYVDSAPITCINCDPRRTVERPRGGKK